MVVSGSLESNVTYFSEELCSRADDALRFAFILTLERNAAHKCVKKAFLALSSRVGELGKEDSISEVVVRECWKTFKETKVTAFTKHDVSDVMSDLSPEVRAGIGAVDYMGLTAESAVKALGISDDELRKSLAAGRKALMSSSLAS